MAEMMTQEAFDKLIGVAEEKPFECIGTKDEVIMLPFKYGAVSFAQKSGMPIIPMGITKKPKLFKRSMVKIGKPFYVKENDDLTVMNEKLQKQVLQGAEETEGAVRYNISKIYKKTLPN